MFGFNINVGVYEKLAKSNDYSAKTRMQAANSCCPCCDNSRCRPRPAPAYSSMYATAQCCTAHRPHSPPRDAARSQITLGRLVSYPAKDWSIIIFIQGLGWLPNKKRLEKLLIKLIGLLCKINAKTSYIPNCS